MKKIFSYILHWWREVSKPYLALIILYTAVLVFINFHWSFEDRYIKPDINMASRLAKYIAMYFLCFGVPYLMAIPFSKNKAALLKPQLWALILFSILIFSVRAWAFQHAGWILDLAPFPYSAVLFKYAVNLAGLVFLFMPCLIYWLIADRKAQPLYGMHAKGVSFKPYFALLLGMVPLLLYAAMQKDFQETYPRAEHLYMTKDIKGFYPLTALYELVYSIDFAVTEFFFRGFIILAFMKYAGTRVLLPMCVFYVSIHFDKPLAECISSFFGGLILGIITYNTRSIYGGIIVHLGIALLMEVLGFVF